MIYQYKLLELIWRRKHGGNSSVVFFEAMKISQVGELEFRVV